MMDKGTLRESLRTRRASLPAAVQREAAEAVCARILSSKPYRHAAVVMAYMAVRGELALSGVLEDVLSSGRTLLLPRCELAHGLTARRVACLRALVRGRYGLLEPPDTLEVVSPETIDLILVPGTAFSRDGARIGQGGGYYDRFLPRTRAYRIGVCHDFALLAQVPQEALDAGVDAVATPQEWIRIREDTP